MTRRYPSSPMLIDERENPTCDFKAQLTRTYLKVACAFANYGMGRILFGVNDEGEPVGLEGDLDDLCLDIEHQLNDSIKPQVRFTLNPDPRLRTITLTVYEGQDKPYTYRGRAYRRSDTSAVEVDRGELRRLSLSGTHLTFDALPAQESGLSFSVLERTLRERLSLDAVGLDAFKTLGLYGTGATPGYTNAAAMLADSNDFAGVRVVAFGESISVIIHDELVARISAITQYQRGTELFRDRYRVQAITGATREPVELVPEEAFREALANAIIHRRWDTEENINVGFWPDRIEVLSPGPLPPEVSEREFFAELVSKPRNPLLAEVFHRLGYVELFGTGVRRINEAYEGTGVAPTYRLTEHHIQTLLPVIPLEPVSEKLTPSEAKVLEVLRSVGALTRREIERETGLSRTTVLGALRTLMDPSHDQVVRAGGGPSTKYLFKR